MCSTEFEHCTWLGTTTQKTKKARACDECGRKISIGEVYVRAAYIYDRDFTVGICCEHCVSAMSWVLAHCGYEMSGGLYDELKEHVEERYTADGLLRLVVGMRRKWARFDGAGLMSVPAKITRATSSVSKPDAGS